MAKKSVEDELKASIASADWNGDGALDGAEFQNWGYGAGMNGPEISNAFQRSDSDGDGRVTPQEYVDNLPLI